MYIKEGLMKEFSIIYTMQQYKSPITFMSLTIY